jgi:hypothetical protein
MGIDPYRGEFGVMVFVVKIENKILVIVDFHFISKPLL